MANYKLNERGKCPHCQTVVKFEPPKSKSPYERVDAVKEKLNIWKVQCPECLKLIVTIEKLEYDIGIEQWYVISEQIVWPLSSGRPPAPENVPSHLADDYNEAALVLLFSPKASAALSRRCLQTLLKEAGKTKAINLSNQIDEVLSSLPAYIAENLDVVRNIGNFAAHEQKSKNTNAILDVEPGEAEWNLDVLDSLFDFYYVRPIIEKKKRDELNKKLEEAGKPLLKKPKGEQTDTPNNGST